MSHPLRVLPAREIEQPQETQQWLIKHLWGRRAVGLLGGSPKRGKTWLGLDIALSVASATPCLDWFPVEDPGRALVYLAEDALTDVRVRIDALCRHRKLDIKDIDLQVIDTPVLRLDEKISQDSLKATLEWVKPKLLVLDPLIRLHSSDENSSAEMARLLSHIRELQRTFDVAILMVHHTTKKPASHPGLTLRGSSELRAFGDSNAYLIQKHDDLWLTVEHRAAPAPDPIKLQLVSSSSQDDTHFRLCEIESNERETAPTRDLADRLLECLGAASGPMTRTGLRAELRVKNERLGNLLTALEASGQVIRTAEGWTLNASQSQSSAKRTAAPLSREP